MTGQLACVSKFYLDSAAASVFAMYIPTMAFITYILLSGLSLGSQGRFDPEKLGEITSMATGWIVLEVLLTLFALFVIQVSFQLLEFFIECYEIC